MGRKLSQRRRAEIEAELRSKPVVHGVPVLHRSYPLTFVRVAKTPLIAMGLDHFHYPQSVLTIVDRLRTAGVLVPETFVGKNAIVSTRIGSRHRPVKVKLNDAYEYEGKNKSSSVRGYVERYYDAVERYYDAVERYYAPKGRGGKPNSGFINAILKRSARTVGRMQALGILHSHPHFGNLIVEGKRVGVIDFKHADVHNIPWTNVKELLRIFSLDYGQIDGGFDRAQTRYLHNSRIFHELHQREVKYFSDIVLCYPCSGEIKKQLLEEIMTELSLNSPDERLENKLRRIGIRKA